VVTELPTVKEAVEAGWTCVTDCCSVEGLRTIVRLFPLLWFGLVRRGCQPRGRPPGPEATLGAVLRSGRVEALLPRHADDGDRIRTLRAAARAAIRFAGELRCVEMDAEVIEGLRPQIAEEYAAGTTARVLSMIRQAVRVHAELCGIEIGSLVARRGGRRVGRRRPRLRPSPEEVMRLLEVSDSTLRGAIVGAAAAGLLPSELLLQRVCDTGKGAVCLQVVHPRTRGLPGVIMDRLAPMAVWGRPVWRAAVLRIGCPYPDATVFPGEHPDPRVAKQSLDKALRGACRRAFGRGGLRFTWLELRLFFQDAAVSAGLPRAVVRSTNSVADRGLGRRRAKRLERQAAAFAEAWTNLHQPPSGWTKRAGRRAPGGTPADQPEGVWRRAAREPMDPLPASCRRPVGGRAGMEVGRPPPGPVARLPVAGTDRAVADRRRPGAAQKDRPPPAPVTTARATPGPPPHRGRAAALPRSAAPAPRPARSQGSGRGGLVSLTVAAALVGAAVEATAEEDEDTIYVTPEAEPGPGCPFSLALLRASLGWLEE